MFKRLLRLATSNRLALALTIFFGWLGGLAAILQAWILSRSIDGVFLAGQGLADVAGLLKFMLGIICLRALATWASERLASSLALRIKSDLRNRLVHHLAELNPAFTQNQKTGELTATALEGVEALEAYFSQYLPQLALATFIPLSILLLVFPLDPLTGLVFLFTAPLIPVFMWLIGKTAESVTQRQWHTLSQLSAYLLDVIQGLTTLKLLGQSLHQAGRIQKASDRYRDVTLSVLRITFLSALTLELLSTLSTAIVAVEIGLRLLYARMSFQQALFILVLAPDFYLPLRLLGLRFHAGMSGTSAARRIFEILDTPLPNSLCHCEEHLPSNDIVPVGQAIPLPGGDCHEPRKTSGSRTSSLPQIPLGQGNDKTGIRFEHVWHTYASRSLPAISDVSLDIPNGQVTALVGFSGAGKSTLAAMLLRFVEPDQGEIRVDGQLLGSICPDEWRQHLSWVPQMPSLFNGSLAENLRLAKPHASDAEIEDACQRADLLDFIRTLPLGLATPIGERGTRLSGGQAQRLALARAYLRDAPLLILDEPTSSLDPLQERRLLHSLHDLMNGRTTLLIAHRLNTVRQASGIIVLDSGRVAETGTHASLLKSGGIYASLVQAGALT
ncbi:MAG: thiol reductant ABC exporter subunit CydD [Chloroflexi bacterium GWB2_49_20]|nr:MAG: thiol reductant ABC exporter subunit CydD [Chloroflexi bacterium GWB2_49_20]OGN79634.1 MAG: thiol reductant ABC exporter subunit CydD [Chloroflexi bacterium GWC2_49_37]OGN83054.1 MAG: thiol reductant ABC exporter subunit CydD [Chloroflexi bacterium GWD2_49_16]HCC78668.1 thiol reductant ABC exporter subunit CydD [Anaerolineae bacterium]